MSWRQILGVLPPAETSHAHNTHNTQNSTDQGICADSAYSAYASPEQNLPLPADDTQPDWRQSLGVPHSETNPLTHNTHNSTDHGICADSAYSAYPSPEQNPDLPVDDTQPGKHQSLGVPPSESNSFTHNTQNSTDQGICADSAQGESAAPGKSRQRPGSNRPRSAFFSQSDDLVQCGECTHFRRITGTYAHPNLGHCAVGEPEAIAGLWDTDFRYCNAFVSVQDPPQQRAAHPSPTQSEKPM